MTRTLKAILVLSLVLNVALVVGFLWFRDYMGSKLSEGWIMAAEAEQHQMRSILADLESNDPNRIAALQEKLRITAEMGEKNIATLREAFE